MVVGRGFVAAHTLELLHRVEFHDLELALYPALSCTLPTTFLPPRLHIIISLSFRLKKLFLIIIIPQHFLFLLLYPLGLQNFSLIKLR